MKNIKYIIISALLYSIAQAGDTQSAAPVDINNAATVANKPLASIINGANHNVSAIFYNKHGRVIQRLILPASFLTAATTPVVPVEIPEKTYKIIVTSKAEITNIQQSVPYSIAPTTDGVLHILPTELVENQMSTQVDNNSALEHTVVQASANGTQAYDDSSNTLQTVPCNGGVCPLASNMTQSEDPMYIKPENLTILEKWQKHKLAAQNFANVNNNKPANEPQVE